MSNFDPAKYGFGEFSRRMPPKRLFDIINPEIAPLDWPRVEEIHQNEFGVTRASDPKPILVTYRIANCVGIAGYSGETGVGFLAHYQHNTDVPSAVGMLLYHLVQATGGQPTTFDVRMKGGLRGMSEHLVNDLRHSLALPLREEVTFRLDGIETEILRSGGGVDLGIDTQTGTFIDQYSPLQNPSHREPLSKEYKALVFSSTMPSIHYTPNL